MLHVNIIYLTCRGQAYANVQKNATQNCIDKFDFVVYILVQRFCRRVSSHIKDTENSFSLLFSISSHASTTELPNRFVSMLKTA